MGRPKGFKLSDEQKKRMQEGRKIRSAKQREGLIDDEMPKSTGKKESSIIGYGWAKNEEFIFPIFKSERDTYKRKLYATIEKARAALQSYVEKGESE